jgi:putative sigma-54 modulation protein
MQIRIQSIHFNVSSQLEQFIEKKAGKLEQYYDDIKKVEVSLKVVKPETVENKEVGIKITIPNGELYATKVKDSFEEATSEAVEALEKQLQKFKEKQRAK